MARKLKTYQTSLGFFEQAIAAPSMKAALDAWGADSNLFHQGAAKESTDSDIIAATMKKPGVVLMRPVGSEGAFGEHAELPKPLGVGGRSKQAVPKLPARKAKKPDEAADRKAALAYELERKRREREAVKEEAASQREHERKQQAIDKAQAAFDKAERAHAKRAGCYPSRDEHDREKGPSRKCQLGKGKGAAGHCAATCTGLAGIRSESFFIPAGIQDRYRQSRQGLHGFRPPPRQAKTPTADPIERSQWRVVSHADRSDPSSSHAPRIHEWHLPPTGRR
jgi:hypothetical protein